MAAISSACLDVGTRTCAAALGNQDTIMLKAAIVTLALGVTLAAQAAVAQTANATPTAGTGAAGGNVSRAAPSVGGAAGASQPAAGAGVGAPTPLERTEEQHSQKTTSSICKGC